jgi:uncharacterized iron-regulated protein
MTKRLTSLLLTAALFVLPCFSLGSHGDPPPRGPLPARVLRVSDRKILPLSGIKEDLQAVRLVFVGELHNSLPHHQAQLAVIRMLHEADSQVAVGLEMFQSHEQAHLDQWVAGNLAQKPFQRIYYRNWTYAWSLYKDIFFFCKEKKVPMIGLNVSPHITRQVARKGFASLSQEQIGQLPEVTCRVDGVYMEFIRRSFGRHGTKGKRFVFFCEAQMVWDTAMAHNLLAFMDKNSQRTVVVLAGNGHAWRHGIPEQIARESNISYRIILPAIPGRLDTQAVSLDDADYLWLDY